MNKIIVADDNKELLCMIGEFLKLQPNMEVSKLFSGGKELLSYLEKDSADLLLLDIFMPDIDGVNILEEIKEKITKQLPDEVQLANIEFEGPEVVIYTKNPDIVADNGDLIRNLAKQLRKRIIIRSDKSVLLSYEETIQRVEEIVPEDAEITNISFDEVTNEVVIEATKPGLVIGKYGVTSREIVRKKKKAPD